MGILIDIIGSIALILFYQAYIGEYKNVDKAKQKRIGLIGIIVTIFIMISPILYALIQNFILK